MTILENQKTMIYMQNSVVESFPPSTAKFKEFIIRPSHQKIFRKRCIFCLKWQFYWLRNVNINLFICRKKILLLMYTFDARFLRICKQTSRQQMNDFSKVNLWLFKDCLAKFFEFGAVPTNSKVSWLQKWLKIYSEQMFSPSDSQKIM